MANVILGVTGGISAYKSVEVARRLQQNGHQVNVVMTKAACKFVGPLTFEAITQRRVVTDQFEPGLNTDIEHIALSLNADLLLVAPATANLIGKFANGIADDFLSSLYLATTAPTMIAPAMNTKMLSHSAVKTNLTKLIEHGVHIIEPGEGDLACGWVGKGRLAEPDEIVLAVQKILRPVASLVGRSLLITAGPTYEDLDSVRYLGNRSTGRMGFALSTEAVKRGARVILIAGPSDLKTPIGVEIVHVRSASEMRDAVNVKISEADVVIMAAAVSDYTPTDGCLSGKIQKDNDVMMLDLSRTTDILAELGSRRGNNSRPILVGFSAQTNNQIEQARNKLRVKKVDLIVANDVTQPGAGFAVETNIATFVTEKGTEEIPKTTKLELAGRILDRIETMFLPEQVSAKS